jgi:hypothetical protein
MAYYVYGDYGYETECELEIFKTEDRARQFINGYTKYGDMGGYNTIEVISFANDGEAITHYRVDAEDLDLGWDWQDDYALEEEF